MTVRDGYDMTGSLNGSTYVFPRNRAGNAQLAISVDTTPPVITPMSPMTNTSPGAAGGMPSDYTAAKTTPIIIQVTDAQGLAYVGVTALYLDGTSEAVYRGGFEGEYLVDSYRNTITNGYELHIRRADGWPGQKVGGGVLAVALAVDAVDTGGNLTSSLLYYQMPAEALASVSTPASSVASGAADIAAEARSLIIWQFRSA